jgi:ABC-type sugar transport system permease subunit
LALSGFRVCFTAVFAPDGRAGRFLLAATFMKLFGFFDIPAPWTWANWQRVLTDPVFVTSLLNTLVVGMGAALIAVFLFSIIAYMTVKSKFAARPVLDFISWLPITLPGILVGIGLLWLFLGNPLFRPFYGTVTLLIIASVISGMPLGTQIIKTNLVQIGSDMEEASLIAGANWWATYRRIVLAPMMPILVLVGVMNFISAARDQSRGAACDAQQPNPCASATGFHGRRTVRESGCSRDFGGAVKYRRYFVNATSGIAAEKSRRVTSVLLPSCSQKSAQSAFSVIRET